MARAIGQATEPRWPGIMARYQSVARDQTSRPSDFRTSGRSGGMRIRAALPGLRCDFLAEGGRRPDFSVIRFGDSDPHLLDHATKRYRRLPLSAPRAAAGAWRIERTGARRNFAFGAASEVLVALDDGPESGRPTLALWLLDRSAAQVDLAIWWDLILPGLDRPRGQLGLPVEITLSLNRYDAPAADMRLKSLRRQLLAAAIFLPPRDFAPEPADRVDRRTLPLVVRPPDVGPPAPPPPARMDPSPLSVVFAAGGTEHAKLLLDAGVIERVRTALNSAAGKLDTFAGRDLVTPTDPLKNVADPVTQALVHRGLLVHFLLQVQEIASGTQSRADFRKIVEAPTDGERGAVTASPGASEEEIARFNRVKEAYITNRAVRTTVDEMIQAESASARALALLLFAHADLAPELVSAARRWLDALLPEFRIEPGPPVMQKNGKDKGWRGDVFVSEGLAKLIDVTVDVGSHSLTLGPSPIGPISLVGPNHPLFVALAAADALVPGSAPPLLRTGVSAQLRLERFSAGATLTTTPTTNSPAIAALLILDPSAVAKLWNYADVTVVLDTVTAEVVIYTEQDRFGLQPPTFKVLVAGAQAGPQSFLDATIAHFSLGPSTLLSALHSELDTEFIQRILDAVEELAEKSLTGALEGLADKLTLQPLLTLDQEPFREAAGARIRLARDAFNEADQARSAAWSAHLDDAAKVDLDVQGNPELGGYNPVALSMPLLDRNGTPLTMAEIDSMQRSFLALSAARMRFERAAGELSAAEMALSKFRSERPPGITVVSGQSEPGGFTLGLSICEPTVPGSGSALTYPVVPMTPLGADVCLVLSGATVIDVFHSIRTGIAYSGPPRNIDRIVESLLDAPELDWWRDAAEPDQLGPRPSDLRDGPPESTLNEGELTAKEWRGFWSVLDVGARNVRLLRVNNPTPAEPIGEIAVVVTVEYGVATYTPATYEYCHDITRLIAEIAEGGSGGLTLPLERPPAGPDGPRPRPDIGPSISIETGFRRIAAPGAGRPGRLVTGRDLEHAKVRLSFPAETGRPGGPRILFSPGPGGGFGPSGRGGDFLCERILGWDVKEREVWLRARREVRLPVFFGIGDRIQLSRNARSTFRFLPLLTCRFDIGEGSAIGGLEIEAGGPLAGLETRANRLWLEQLMVAHAFTLLTAPAARYRRTSENGLSYAYGATFGTRLTPENFTPRLLLALHPTHWSTGDRLVDDPAVPFLTLETFGANPDLLNLAVKLTLDENVLGSI